MSGQDHLETIARRAAALQQKINDAGIGPAPCPRCAALEADVRRLQETVESLSDDSLMVLAGEVSTARALLGELAAATKALIAVSSTWCQERTTALALAVMEARENAEAVLRRAEAEAGGGEGK